MLTYFLETGQFWLRHNVYNPIKLKSTALALLKSYAKTLVAGNIR